jgi:hypothetical protein
MRAHLRLAGVLLVAVVTAATPLLALEAHIMELRVAGGHLRASIEIKEMFPDKLRAVLEQRGAIHLRLQIELWQHRPVWDKQPQPAVLAVFRIVLDPVTRLVQVADQYGEVSRQPAWQEPLALRLDLGRGDVLSDTGRYYIRTQATLGTIAEREATQAADAVFGPDEGSVTLGSMGRLLFHAVLQVNDYLQSVSAEARTRDITGAELKAGVKP